MHSTAMFTVMSTPQPFTFGRDAASPYRPAVSSPLSSSPLRQSSSPPLSPLNANVQPRLRETQSSPIPGAAAVKPIPFKFAGRNARPNPVVQKRDDAREGRRKLFLQNVRQRAEDKKWEKRGGDNELLRLEWSRLNRELYQAKDADIDGLLREGDLEDAWQSQSGRPMEMEVDLDDQMIDALEHNEAAEIDALVSSLPLPSTFTAEPASPHFSDDDDYDAIFNDFIQHDEDHMVTSSADVEML